MAQVPSDAGIPDVAPDAAPPDRYQRIDASPNKFGAQIGQGLEQLGSGAKTAGEFFGKVAADDATNQYVDFETKLLHGDPNKQTQGPDGQPQPDTGYMSLQGDAALRARPDVESQLDAKLKELRGGLTTPEQQLEFDTLSRRYRAAASERIGTHADTQSKTWYQSVNNSSAKLALDGIANNADNPQIWQAHESDLVHAYVKNAQIAGATPDSPQFAEAVAAARRDALKARLDAIAVKDPSKAQAILDVPANKAIAGSYYDNLSSAYRGRAKQQQGYDVGAQTIRGTYTDRPAPNPVVLTNAGAQYGISGAYLQRVHEIEGNGTSSTGAQGPFQFVPSTAAKYGLKDPFNYEQAADAAAHLAADNKVSLTASLGRQPTDPELYLAHQQGAAGAAKLLANPAARAGDLVGDRAIRVNGGNPDAPAAAFTSLWTQKFNKAPVEASENRKAAAYQKILSIPDSDIDPDVRQHALTYVTQTIAAQQIAEEQDAKAKKAASDQKQSDFTSRIIQGNTNGIIGEIANSGLPASEMQNLYKFAIGDGGVSDPLQYGPAYTDTLKRLLAKPDDPAKITDPAEIIRMGADGTLTKRGVGELMTTMDKLKKQPDQSGIATVKASQLKYYQSKMGIDDDMSAITGKPYKNQKGVDKFNHEFVPAFESAYSQWIGSGKDPMEFLNDSKKMDEIMNRVYPPAQRAADSITANGGTGEKPDMTIPPAPAGVNKNTFETIVKHPPMVGGVQMTPSRFSDAIKMLRENPDDVHKQSFNKHFGPAGFDADEILKKLPPAQKQADADPIQKLLSDNATTPYSPPEGPVLPVAVGVRG